jgi:hypothetical protein
MRFAAPTTPLHAGLPLGDHERGVQRHPRRARATQQAAHLELGPRGRRGLEPGLLEHAGRRLPPAQRLDRRRRHPQLPDRLPPSLRSDRADPGRKLRSRPAARVRQPQRRHAAPGRRAARHRDRRLDRPPRSLRQPPLVDPLPGALPFRRAAPTRRTGAGGELRCPRPNRDRQPQRCGYVVVRSRERAEPAREAVA